MSDQTPQPATNSLKSRLRLKQNNEFHMGSTTNVPTTQSQPFTPQGYLPTPTLTANTSSNTNAATQNLAVPAEKPKVSLRLNKNQSFNLAENSANASQTKADPLQNSTIPPLAKATPSIFPHPMLSTAAPGFQPAPMFNPAMGMPMMGMGAPMMMNPLQFQAFPQNNFTGMPFNPMGMNFGMPINNVSTTPNIQVTANNNKANSSLNMLLGSSPTIQTDVQVTNEQPGTAPNQTPIDPTNYSNEETKKLAQKLAQKKQQAIPSVAEAPSKEALQNAEKEKRLLEQERAKAEEEAKKNPVQEAKNDGAADDASDDSESYKSQGEDLTKLPQDRPAVIRYTKAMILDFVKKESKKTFEDDYRFENLIREIQKFNRKDHPSMFEKSGGQKGNFSRGGDRNDRGNYSQTSRGSNNSKY